MGRLTTRVAYVAGNLGCNRVIRVEAGRPRVAETLFEAAPFWGEGGRCSLVAKTNRSQN